jgi:hypothetical protein
MTIKPRLATTLLVVAALMGGLALTLPLISAQQVPHSPPGTVYCAHLFGNRDYATYCTIPTR